MPKDFIDQFSVSGPERAKPGLVFLSRLGAWMSKPGVIESVRATWMDHAKAFEPGNLCPPFREEFDLSPMLPRRDYSRIEKIVIVAAVYDTWCESTPKVDPFGVKKAVPRKVKGNRAAKITPVIAYDALCDRTKEFTAEDWALVEQFLKDVTSEPPEAKGGDKGMVAPSFAIGELPDVCKRIVLDIGKNEKRRIRMIDLSSCPEAGDGLVVCVNRGLVDLELADSFWIHDARRRGEDRPDQLLSFFVKMEEDQAWVKLTDSGIGLLSALKLAESKELTTPGGASGGDAGSGSTAKEPLAEDEDSYLSPSGLALKYGVPKEPLRKRLDRWREKNHEGWIENPDRMSREAQYLYRVGSVQPVVDKLKASIKASSNRPAKKI